MNILDQLKVAGIVEPEHLGDGAYIGRTAEGVAIFTSNGMTYTRPVFLEDCGVRSLLDYLTRKGLKP